MDLITISNTENISSNKKKHLSTEPEMHGGGYDEDVIASTGVILSSDFSISNMLKIIETRTKKISNQAGGKNGESSNAWDDYELFTVTG